MRSSARTVLALVSLSLVVAPRPARAVDLMVYKVSLKIVAGMVVPGTTGPDTIVLKKLSNDDVANLALGQPLGTKIKPLMLAGAGDFEDRMTNAPVSKLIVFDPSQNGVAQKKATVAIATSLTYQGGQNNKASKGFGFGSGSILDTTLGDPSMNGFISTNVNGGATGSGAHLGVGPHFEIVFPAISGIGTLSGPIKFNYTDKNGMVVHFDGIIVAGQGKVSGKPISSFTE